MSPNRHGAGCVRPLRGLAHPPPCPSTGRSTNATGSGLSQSRVSGAATISSANTPLRLLPRPGPVCGKDAAIACYRTLTSQQMHVYLGATNAAFGKAVAITQTAGPVAAPDSPDHDPVDSLALIRQDVHCARPRGDKPLAIPQGRPAARNANMTTAHPQHDPPVRATGDIAAERACLRCKALFQSEGFGERICPRCKATVLWKSAIPARDGHSRKG